ncbi:unnamed protein product [Spodoptera exigua]|nr:unnamed protein product [Spodoptera exigua]
MKSVPSNRTSPNDKRHRSSSSLAGAVLEGTRSERKLDMNGTFLAHLMHTYTYLTYRVTYRPPKIAATHVASISEMADQFATAEVRCDDLQDKIDLIKSLKRKRKLKKRSIGKNCASFADYRGVTASRKTTSAGGATEPYTRILGPCNCGTAPDDQPSAWQTPSSTVDQRQFPKHRQQRSQADNDSLGGRSQPLNEVLEVASGQDITGEEYSNAGLHNRLSEYKMRVIDKGDDQPVVELFNKSQNGPTHVRRVAAAPTAPAPLESLATHDKKTKKVRNLKCDEDTAQMEDIVQEPKKVHHEGSHHRRIRYRSRRYELPTVASQMKQAGMRYYYGTSNHTNIPFVVSKSTAPSHNIGVNIQQVLNGLKIQQPLSGIPLTIAHHMGLGHVPTYGPKSADVEPSLDHREINAIRVGRRLLRLPSYKYMSYNQLLSLYREGDGMVPRFLRAISRPHYFYTSMYNLATNREDFDGATSKGRGGNQEAKQSLAEYASLYREYEQVDKCIKEGNFEPELERRRDELTRELASREEHIRRVVQEYRTGGEADPILRASASTAEDGYRHSTFKLGDVQQ